MMFFSIIRMSTASPRTGGSAPQRSTTRRSGSASCCSWKHTRTAAARSSISNDGLMLHIRENSSSRLTMVVSSPALLSSMVTMRAASPSRLLPISSRSAESSIRITPSGLFRSCETAEQKRSNSSYASASARVCCAMRRCAEMRARYSARTNGLET